MKTINKLLIISMIMVFGLLFQTKVFAGETKKDGEINLKCKKSEGGTVSTLNGCSFSIYKIFNNERVLVDTLTTTTTTHDIYVEIIKDKVYQFVIVEDSAPAGYYLDGDSERTVTFEWSDDEDVLYYPDDIEFLHNKIGTVTLLSMNKPQDQGGTIYQGHVLSIRNTDNQVLNTCAITDLDNTLLVEYYVDGGPCSWTSNGKPVHMSGFTPGATYVFYDETSNNSSQTFTFTDGSTVAIYYDTTSGGDYGASRSNIGLFIALSVVVLGFGMLIYVYVKKARFTNNKI